MLDGLFMLLTLSTVMAIASFLAGSLPLTFTLSHSQLRLISTVGMGILVGTSLIVIIPEGIETLYSASSASQTAHTHRALSTPPLSIRWPPATPWLSPRDPSNALPNPVIPANPDTPSTTPTPRATAAHRTPHAWIGLSLILGFTLMYLIDHGPALLPTAPPPPHPQTIYSLSDLSHPPPPPPSSGPSLSTTLGLSIHALADGIALGASSTTPSSLSLLIFLAIMIHKAPAAFGLTSVLLRQGVGKRGARARLVLFSLAAPVGAVGTWVLVRGLGGAGAPGGEEGMRWWTGVGLLFSGGTFLYVAMHTMQEDDEGGHGQGDAHGNAYVDGGMGRETRRKEGKSLGLVLAAVGGMLLPLIAQIGHAH